ncbi:MAG: putative zinc-binding metallopeptidase, partial [Pseudomonadota bacterium]
MRRFSCAICRHDVFFDNTVCVGCGADLGYAPALGKMLASKDGREWRVADAVFVPCANRTDIDCNWLVSPDEEDCFCAACRHNRVIPDLTVAGNATLWRKIELAKRTLFYSLIEWGLPHPTKLQDSARGLAFDFLADEEHSDGSVRPHLPGHSSGLITITLAEGDDAERERRRTEMG